MDRLGRGADGWETSVSRCFLWAYWEDMADFVGGPWFWLLLDYSIKFNDLFRVASRTLVICHKLPSLVLFLSRWSPWTINYLKTPYLWLMLKIIYLNFCQHMLFGKLHRVWEATLTIQGGLSNLPLDFLFEADVWSAALHLVASYRCGMPLSIT